MAESQAERDKALPYYRWYVQDYRGSRSVQRLTWQERGIYRDLIDECWDKGCIPDDPAALADVVGCQVEEMAEAWPRIRRLFEEYGDGLLYSPRLEKERSAADRSRIQKVIAGRRGGLAKASNARNGASGAKGALASSSSSEQLEQSKSSSTYAPPAARPSGAASVGVCPECERAAPKHHDECPLRPASPADIAAITASLKLVGARR